LKNIYLNKYLFIKKGDFPRLCGKSPKVFSKNSSSKKHKHFLRERFKKRRHPHFAQSARSIVVAWRQAFRLRGLAPSRQWLLRRILPVLSFLMHRPSATAPQDIHLYLNNSTIFALSQAVFE
jgi:hypothetical protein